MISHSDLTPIRDAVITGETVSFRDIETVCFFKWGKPHIMAVDMEHDPVQRNHRQGRYYEEKELREVRRFFPKDGVFVDVGANTGNHSLYIAHKLSPKTIVVIEPNPRAARLLLANVVLNNFQSIFELSLLGFGLSDRSASNYSCEIVERNLGSARLLPDSGHVEVHAGDDLLGDMKVDIIKIDVEGMELEVLRGLDAAITRNRPVILVEVDNEHAQSFDNWLDANNYKIYQTFVRYKVNKNHIVVPFERWDEFEI